MAYMHTINYFRKRGAAGAAGAARARGGGAAI